MENISEKVIGILKDNIEELEGINVQKDTALITSGYVDSFDIINVISVLEEAFGIKLVESTTAFGTRIGVVTGCHTGPTALGLAFMPKHNKVII